MRGLLRVAMLVGWCGAAACGESATGPQIETEELAALASVLNLDFTDPPNYESPAYPQHYDAGVRADDNAPANNPVTDEGALLGRVLFYDEALSLNNTIGCASCHVQELGFTDDRTLSVGFEGVETGTHSMRLANANFFPGETMFWNHRANDLEDQALQPVMDAVEMGFSAEAGGLAAVITRLEGTTYYPVLFEYAFGTEEITETRMGAAIAQYVRSIVSTGSRFDEAVVAAGGGVGQGPTANLPGFTAQENLGLRLFQDPPDQGGAGCAGCHEIPTFALDDNRRSNGLDAGETVIFKSPSLKNVAVAGPYMHDGRFATLEEVVEHYDSGIQLGPALDNRLRFPNGQPMRLNLSADERAALVAFMGTLTDDALLADAKFGDPFVR